MTRAQSIAVIGAGQIGRVIADMLARSGHKITLADQAPIRARATLHPGIVPAQVDATDDAALRRLLGGQDIVVSACPYFLNKGIAAAAAATGTHYFDLTEDVATTAFIRDLAKDASVALMPQCGLAPGFICVLGADMATHFETAHSIRMRVGALPRFPTNALGYNITWSVDGLINEYCNPCEIVQDGLPILAPPLEGLETVMIDGVAYEAFHTSGGLGTLTETLAGRVRDMSYQTLRYPGHAEIMKLLLRGLGLAGDRATLRNILTHAAPFTADDTVIIFVTGIGARDGLLQEESLVLRYDGTEGQSAIQMTTASGLVAMIELFLAGRLPQRGFIRQEDASLADMLATTAGQRLAAALPAGQRARLADKPSLAA
ncbi:saccharopine dehydrogenase C-terminal domain-containing protein [Telmatospirillum sp.]|uniref:saccharopine dehydrogenase family protein n=1 Tax=Telmatospirillum sp. TaxID=2079197 RepID=UPI00283C957A|nr:saccharopine dehydrogenase C-terminal domain-containing protein [Telmatospirillum sp.]MDR3436792.1 saccharopine dehydrogenase NADP-binding domain-containing protein [Telmatospirillum sp.]